MKFSVITVVLNDASGIRTTLQSLLEQSYPHIEHIIIDGGSTDGTLDVIENSKLPGTVVVSEPDDGIYDAMNKGLALATGEVVSFLNAADVFDSASTLLSVAGCFQDPEVDAVYGDISFFNDEGMVMRRWRAGTYRFWKFYFGWAVPHPALFIRASAFHRIGSFDSSFRIAGEYEFMLRCFLRHGIRPHYVREDLAHMKIGGVSNRSLGNILSGAKEVRRAWVQNRLRFGWLAPWLKPLRKIPQYLVLKSYNSSARAVRIPNTQL